MAMLMQGSIPGDVCSIDGRTSLFFWRRLDHKRCKPRVRQLVRSKPVPRPEKHLGGSTTGETFIGFRGYASGVYGPGQSYIGVGSQSEWRRSHVDG